MYTAETTDVHEAIAYTAGHIAEGTMDDLDKEIPNPKPREMTSGKASDRRTSSSVSEAPEMMQFTEPRPEITSCRASILYGMQFPSDKKKIRITQIITAR